MMCQTPSHWNSLDKRKPGEDGARLRLGGRYGCVVRHADAGTRKRTLARRNAQRVLEAAERPTACISERKTLRGS